MSTLEAPRARRSALYMPGSNARALEKAKTIAADALILDLEDAVAPDAKEAARENVCAAVTSGEYGERELTIRVNGIGTAWHAADLAAAAAAGPAAVVVPKVNSVEDVLTVASGLEGTDVSIWAMIETPVAIADVAAIASASPRLTVLVMGTNDLVAELHATHVPGRAPILTALSQSVLAARAAGIVILDGVFNDVSDDAGFAEECLQGKAFGFDGKTLIHPKQVEPCNVAFSPSEAEIDHAHRVIAAFEEALAKGHGVVTVDGKMIENLHVATARRILALAGAAS
jgi:citrate lyase subunit beta/citryl-CoA lyase